MHTELEAAWRKSSRSTDTGQCVEVADLHTHIGVRDSKDPEGPVLSLDQQAFRALLEAARAQ